MSLIWGALHTQDMHGPHEESSELYNSYGLITVTIDSNIHPTYHRETGKVTKFLWHMQGYSLSTNQDTLTNTTSTGSIYLQQVWYFGWNNSQFQWTILLSLIYLAASQSILTMHQWGPFLHHLQTIKPHTHWQMPPWCRTLTKVTFCFFSQKASTHQVPIGKGLKQNTAGQSGSPWHPRSGTISTKIASTILVKVHLRPIKL